MSITLVSIHISVNGGRSPFAAVGGTDFGGGGSASVAMVDAMVETGDAASTSSDYFIASSKVGSWGLVFFIFNCTAGLVRILKFTEKLQG